MFKELFLAIIFGGLIGFGATGTFIALKRKTTPVVNNSTIQITVTPVVSQNPNQITPTIAPSVGTLEIFQPLNESVVSQSKVTIKGQSEPSSIIIITTLDNSYSVTADSAGNFDTTINLSPGINQIKITSVAPNDNQKDAQLFVTYTTAKI